MQYGQTSSAFADLGNDTFYRYSYNSRGELTQAAGYLGTSVTTLTAPLPGRLFDFGYDQAGNRTSANSTGVSGLQNDYTPNGLNQVASRENNFVPVSGTVNSAAKVVVNGSLAGQQGNYWSGEAVLNNTSGPAYTTSLSVKAAKASPHEKEIPSLLSAFIPAASESFTYDADGNVTDDGQWDYTWDAENRLVKMETDSVAMGVGLPGKRLVFRYDSLGRRTAKEVWSYSGSSWSKTNEVRFVYQGWNLVAELDTTSSLMRSYAWGLDLSGSLSGMGGIGALVQIADHTGTVASYLPGYDGQGNVAAVMKSDGTISASYEYGPFGDLLRRKGTYASTNPFRSATKYTDDESGLVYYGLRYYSPSLGRFLGRDPIGEAGGMNLYGFVGNNPVNGWDYLGMDANVTTSGGTNANGDYVSYTVYNDGPDWYSERNKALATASREVGGPPRYSDFGEQHRAETNAWKEATKPYFNSRINVPQVSAAGTNKENERDYYENNGVWNEPGTSRGSPFVNANRPIAPNNTGTTTIQILGRPILGDPTGSLHTSILIQSGSQSAVISGQPSKKLTGVDEILNVYGFDRGVVILPQTPASMQRSGEYQIYLAADQRNFLATYESPTVTLNRSFDDVMADVARFNQAVIDARIPYLASTQNSNSYTFTLATRLTGQTFTPSANYQVPGNGTQLKIPQSE